jgi:predicted glutamine amidotransferase
MLMCRMFGMIAAKPEGIAGWMLETPTCLRSLAVRDASGEPNADGWGIGWYETGGEMPHVVKLPIPANESWLFEQTARSVSGTTVLAHIRRSSGTPRVLANIHPFADGRWLFCHNGHCARERLLGRLPPESRDRLAGDNDSEVYFAVLLQHLESGGDSVDALTSAVHEVMAVGDYTGLNFLLTDGGRVFAFRYSTAPERHGLCLRHTQDAELVASEPLGGEEWEELPNGSLAVLTAAGHTVHSLI